MPEHANLQPPVFLSDFTITLTMSSPGSLDCKVYIGDLDYSAAKQDLEDMFCRYGPLKSVWVARNPPGFAFVEFKNPEDAEDAVSSLDGT